MRLIRLADPHFPDLAAVDHYFLDPQSPFRNRGPFATFIFQPGHIDENGLRPGETLLFSYEGTVYYVATAHSGRKPWDGPGSDELPYCFHVNIASLRRTRFTVQELATALGVPIPASHAWPILPDGVQPEWAVNTLCGCP